MGFPQVPPTSAQQITLLDENLGTSGAHRLLRSVIVTEWHALVDRQASIKVDHALTGERQYAMAA